MVFLPKSTQSGFNNHIFYGMNGFNDVLTLPYDPALR